MAVSAKTWAELWLSANPSKAWTEVLFLAISPFWIALMAGIVVTGVYEQFGNREYCLVGAALAVPYWVVPAVLGGSPDERAGGVRFADTYWFKANVWIVLFSYVGNFFWTHYFYTLLGARYTFPSERFNDVPISMFGCVHGYFVFYHTLTSCAIRRARRTDLYAGAPDGGAVRGVVNVGVVCALAYVTAWMETKTIEAFPYYDFEDRAAAQTIGSVVYGIYFIVSFPMFLRLDEEHDGGGGQAAAAGAINEGAARAKPAFEPCWTWQRAAIDSLGAAMLVTIMLDMWRILVGKVYGGQGANPSITGLTWFGK